MTVAILNGVFKKSVQGESFLAAIGKSFYDSIGDIVFGMEDGTVSIFGLVFGVASSTISSSVVLLAGATGAISAAVSMMAGTFLDVESTNDQAQAQLAQEQQEIDTNLEGQKQDDLQNYLSCVNFKGHLSFINIDGHPSNAEGESTLDIQMVAGLAPAASINVYQTDGNADGDTWTQVNDELQRIIDDNIGTPNLVNFDQAVSNTLA